MKKTLFAVLGLISFFVFSSPAPAEAQGVGLKCDTPNCRYMAYDSQGRFLDDRYPRGGIHDPSPYYSPHVYPYAQDSVFSRRGTTIINPSPGTTMSVKKKSGGVICSPIFRFLGCGEETVDFSTVQKSNPTPTQQVPPQSPPAVAEENKVKEENLPQ